MRAIRERIPFFLLALAAVLVDEATQAWLQRVLQPSESRMPELFCHPLLRFNPDFAWGLLSLPFDRVVTVSVGLSVVAAAGLVFLLLRARGLVAVSLALLLGAVVAGCLDRLRYGSVVDFLVCQGNSSASITFNAGDLLAFLALWLLGGKALTAAIGRRRINMDNPPRDDSGTL